MKNECSIVRDILPLYLENMVSDETGTFVKEHLKGCPECTAELEALKAGPKVEKIGNEMRDSLEAEVMKSMKATRKKFRKKAYRVAAVIAGIFIIVCVLLHFFPVYRIVDIGSMTMGNYYSSDQIARRFISALHLTAEKRKRFCVWRIRRSMMCSIQALKTKKNMACLLGMQPIRIAMVTRRSLSNT